MGRNILLADPAYGNLIYATEEEFAGGSFPNGCANDGPLFISSLASYLPPLDARIEALLDDPLKPSFCDELAAHL